MLKPKLTDTVRLGIIDAPVRYRWSNSIACRFEETVNSKLLHAVDLINYRSKMAIGALVSELIMWRFEGLTDIDDGMKKSEAAWACAIDPLYSKDLNYCFTDDHYIHDKDPVFGAIEIALSQLETIQKRYAQGGIYLTASVTILILVARHVFPKKTEFSSWLSDTLQHTENYFKRGMSEKDFYSLKSYDYSHEKPCFREFFEPDFVYTDENARDAINRFLQSLDPNENPYLRTPDEMKAVGFSGVPYTY